MEEYRDVIEAMLMLGVHSKVAADEETVEASVEYIDSDVDDEEKLDEAKDVEINENEAFENTLMNFIGNRVLELSMHHTKNVTL